MIGRSRGPQRARRATTLVEIIVALSMLAMGLVPLASLSRQGIQTARIERTREAGRLLATSLLARFGHVRCLPALRAAYLGVTGDPEVYANEDALSHPELRRLLDAEVFADLIRDSAMSVALRLSPGPGTGTFRLTVELTWVEDRNGTAHLERRTRHKPLFDELP